MVRRGAQSTGKAAYVTATFPVIILFSLVIRGLTLEGAMDGMRYYLIPDPKEKILKLFGVFFQPEVDIEIMVTHGFWLLEKKPLKCVFVLL